MNVIDIRWPRRISIYANRLLPIDILLRDLHHSSIDICRYRYAICLLRFPGRAAFSTSMLAYSPPANGEPRSHLPSSLPGVVRHQQPHAAPPTTAQNAVPSTTPPRGGGREPRSLQCTRRASSRKRLTEMTKTMLMTYDEDDAYDDDDDDDVRALTWSLSLWTCGGACGPRRRMACPSRGRRPCRGRAALQHGIVIVIVIVLDIRSTSVLRYSAPLLFL